MAEVKIKCPYCGSEEISLYGKNAKEKQMWFEKCLLPCLKEGTTIVMDNASFHRKRQLYEICSKYGYNLIFLPPYSPELNPIEKYWYILKHRIKAFLHQHISLNDSIHYSFLYPYSSV